MQKHFTFSRLFVKCGFAGRGSSLELIPIPRLGELRHLRVGERTKLGGASRGLASGNAVFVMPVGGGNFVTESR